MARLPELQPSEEEFLIGDTLRGQEYKVQWKGSGARVALTIGAGEGTYHMVFVLDRVDSPPHLEGLGIQKPRVIRLIAEADLDSVTDYVLYPETELSNERLWEYNLPREIDNLDDFYRGEAPIASAFLNDSGTETVLGVAKAVTLDDGMSLEVPRGDEEAAIIRKLEQVPLSKAGTPPIYPVRVNSPV